MKVLVFLAFLIILVKSNQPTLNLFRSSQQLQKNVSNLVSSSKISQQFCPTDTSIRIAQLGAPNPVILITCNVHARQLITAEVCVDLINQLVATKDHLLDHFHFKIIYDANSERDKVLKGNYCLRGNKNNVDLNRNFPSTRKFITSKGQTNPGPFPLSETYSQCIDYLANKYKPLAYIDFHSGEFSLIYYKPAVMLENQEQDKQKLSLLTKVKSEFCKNCRVINILDIPTQLGQSIVYLKQKYQVKYSSIWQIYGGYSIQQTLSQSCLRMFNPLGRRQLLFYRKKWVSAIIYYLEQVRLLEQQKKGKK